MARIRKEAESALRLTKERMKTAYEAAKLSAHQFRPGDKVWLSAKDIHLHQNSAKLGPRQLGPFSVVEKIGELDYRLELPDWLKVHSVFHVDRLSPWRDNNSGRPQPPPPAIVGGEEEYEVDCILDSRVHRRQLQYLVHWKGYPVSERTWETRKNLKHAKEEIDKFHRSHPDADAPREPRTKRVRKRKGRKRR